MSVRSLLALLCIFIVPTAQPDLLDSLGARPLHSMPNIHRAAQAPSAIPEGHSRPGAMVSWLGADLRSVHGWTPVCYLTVGTHYKPGALIPECNGSYSLKRDLISALPLVYPC